MSEVGRQRLAMQINTAKDVTAYENAYELAMLVFESTKRLPDEEKFALTSQIRRSSRSTSSLLIRDSL